MSTTGRPLKRGSHPDMAEFSLVTEGQLATGVDFVVADAEVALALCAGMSFDLGVKDFWGDPSPEATVRSALVVIRDEGVDLALQLRQ